MSIPQQIDTLTNIIKNAIDEALSNTHTAIIAKITKINNSTINAKPVFKRVVNDVEIDLPVFVDIPIMTLQGGSNYRIMPISVGDYTLLIFSERCIDDWYLGADNKKPREYRIHDYSDAIAIVGLNNINNAISIPSGYEKVNGDVVHTGKNTQIGDFIITGTINQTGDNTIIGNLKATNIEATAGYKINGVSGVSGTFTTVDGKTVTVTNGIITSIV